MRKYNKQSCHSCKLCSKGAMDVNGEPLVSRQNLLLCFFMLYLFPVIGLIIGVVVGMMFGNEISEIIFGFAFFLASCLYVIRFDRKYEEKSRDSKSTVVSQLSDGL